MTARRAGASVEASWGGSCVSGDTDFAVYEGPLGQFDGHAPVTCNTAGVTQHEWTTGPGSRYFLVVPRTAGGEGSHGRNGAGDERSAGAVPCAPRALTACDP